MKSRGSWNGTYENMRYDYKLNANSIVLDFGGKDLQADLLKRLRVNMVVRYTHMKQSIVTINRWLTKIIQTSFHSIMV